MNFNDKMKFYAEYTQKKLKEYNCPDSDTEKQKTLIDAIKEVKKYGKSKVWFIKCSYCTIDL